MRAAHASGAKLWKTGYGPSVARVYRSGHHRSAAVRLSFLMDVFFQSLFQADPRKNRRAEWIDFETRHTFIDHCIVRRISDRSNRLFLFKYFLRLRIEPGALSNIQCLSRAINQIVEQHTAPS